MFENKKSVVYNKEESTIKFNGWHDGLFNKIYSLKNIDKFICHAEDTNAIYDSRLINPSHINPYYDNYNCIKYKYFGPISSDFRAFTFNNNNIFDSYDIHYKTKYNVEDSRHLWLIKNIKFNPYYLFNIKNNTIIDLLLFDDKFDNKFNLNKLNYDIFIKCINFYNGCLPEYHINSEHELYINKIISNDTWIPYHIITYKNFYIKLTDPFKKILKNLYNNDSKFIQNYQLCFDYDALCLTEKGYNYINNLKIKFINNDGMIFIHNSEHPYLITN